MANRNRSSQATASAYGWVFQVGAGIYLMLEKVKEFTHIEMESKNEDIEITYADGSKLYAQAKSVTDPNDKTNIIANLSKSLKTLGKADDGNTRLVYINNYPDPLTKNNNPHYFYGKHAFNMILDSEKQIIRDKANDDFSFDNFEIINIKFDGNDDDQRFATITERIKNVLGEANVDMGYANKIMKIWIADLICNASKKNIKMDKADIIYPLLQVFLEQTESEESYNKVCDNDLYDETTSKYIDYINSSFKKCEITLKIAGDYQSARDSNRNINIYDFIKSNWINYKSMFSTMNFDEDMEESFIKMFLLTILKKKDRITNIKRAVNL